MLIVHRLALEHSPFNYAGRKSTVRIFDSLGFNKAREVMELRVTAIAICATVEIRHNACNCFSCVSEPGGQEWNIIISWSCFTQKGKFSVIDVIKVL